MLQDVTVPIQGRLSLSTPVSVDLKSEALWRGGAKGLPRTNNPGPNLLENVKVTDKESQKKKSFL